LGLAILLVLGFSIQQIVSAKLKAISPSADISSIEHDLQGNIDNETQTSQYAQRNVNSRTTC
jgi:hypothetical protein